MKLPEYYLITPDWPLVKLLPYLVASIAQGIRLIQIRSWTLTRQDLESLLNELRKNSPAAQILINSSYPESLLIAQEFSVGLHLQSSVLMQTQHRILDIPLRLAASCHNDTELKRAEKIGVDFSVLSPVKMTSSHENATPLGWHQFKWHAEQIRSPIFALGGLDFDDLSQAKKNGAYGIAGISQFLCRYSSN